MWIEQKNNRSEQQLIIGNWYTQYSTGYWQQIDLNPKYAEKKYNSDSIS